MRRIVVIALSVILALVVAMPIASGKPALSNNSQTLGKLGAVWWKRVLEEPVSTNPLYGSYTEGPQCAVSTIFQKREVFFLAGTQTGEAVTRQCTVSHKSWIFFPVVNYVDIEPVGTLTKAEIRRIVKQNMDSLLVGSTMFVTIDGKPVPVSIKKNRADTPFFIVNLPTDNIFGGPAADAPAGVYKGAGDGVWVLLRPLKKGTHTITFGGTFKNGAFSQNNTYILTVV